MDWKDLTQRLARELMHLPANAFLVVQVPGGFPYAQAMRYPNGLSAEVVSNEFLPPPLQLGAEAQLRLVGLDWEEPGRHGHVNWWQQVPLPPDTEELSPEESLACGRLAASMTAALHQVYGVRGPEQLEYRANRNGPDGGPLVLPYLGIPPVDSMRAVAAAAAPYATASRTHADPAQAHQSDPYAPSASPSSGPSGYPDAGQNGYADPVQTGYPDAGQAGYGDSGRAGYAGSGPSGYADPVQDGYPDAGQSGYPGPASALPLTDERVAPVAPRPTRSRLYLAPTHAGGALVTDLPPMTDPDEVDRVAKYLRRGTGVLRGGSVLDEVEPARGEIVPIVYLTDGVWVWSAAQRYYLERYGIPPTPAFYEHIVAQGYQVPEVSEELLAEAGEVAMGSLEPYPLPPSLEPAPWVTTAAEPAESWNSSGPASWEPPATEPWSMPAADSWPDPESPVAPRASAARPESPAVRGPEPYPGYELDSERPTDMIPIVRADPESPPEPPPATPDPQPESGTWAAAAWAASEPHAGSDTWAAAESHAASEGWAAAEPRAASDTWAADSRAAAASPAGSDAWAEPGAAGPLPVQPYPMNRPEPVPELTEDQARFEERLADARARGDHRSYFRLILDGELILPSTGDPEDRQYATADFDDGTYVLSYTSPAAMRAALPGQPGFHRRVPFRYLVEDWPKPEWRLSINASLPSAAFADPATVEGLAGPPAQEPAAPPTPAPIISTPGRQPGTAPDAMLAAVPPANVLPQLVDPSAYAPDAPADPYAPADPHGTTHAPDDPYTGRGTDPYGSPGTEAHPARGSGSPDGPYAPYDSPGTDGYQPGGYAAGADAPPVRGSMTRDPADDPYAAHGTTSYDPSSSGPSPAWGSETPTQIEAPYPAGGTAAPGDPYAARATDPPEDPYTAGGTDSYEPAGTDSNTALGPETRGTDAAVVSETRDPHTVLGPDLRDDPSAAGGPDSYGSPGTDSAAGPYARGRTDPGAADSYGGEVSTRGAEAELDPGGYGPAGPYAAHGDEPYSAMAGSYAGLEEPTEASAASRGAGTEQAADWERFAVRSVGRYAAPLPPATREHDATIMQKAVPPEHVVHYLQHGYDQVAGYVHRLYDVQGLGSPEQLVGALGLVYPGSPFTADDDVVHVLRWPAVKHTLFRPALPKYADDAIPEFRIDSQRLPHGAELHRLDRFGGQTLLAVFDSDRRRWRRSHA